MHDQSDDELLTPADVAREFHIATQTLANWRCTRRYVLPFVRVGRGVRYRRADIKRFIASRTVSDE